LKFSWRGPGKRKKPATAWKAGCGFAGNSGEKLLCFLLLLLTDADFALFLLAFHECFVIMTGDSIFEIRIDVGIRGQDYNYGEVFVTGRAKGPKTLYIRD
jgi:hypothetical protein